jgi:macrodomain Ter protein organizer (MatP/YcbG family)
MGNSRKKTKHINVEIPFELWRVLKSLAADKNWTMADTVIYLALQTEEVKKKLKLFKN